MNEQILSLLQTIEHSHNVTILYACEAGSRAWNLHHEKSDYDVRFIFIHPINQYLSINEPKQVIEGKSSDHIEYSGWDLKKSLQLLKKQNPSILEWLHSSIHYLNQNDVKEQLLSLHQRYFQEKPLLHHYFNMAKTNIKLLDKKPSTKLLLNVIRPLLLCEWIMTYKEFPPVHIERVLSIIESKEVKGSIQDIIARKRNAVCELSEVVHTLKKWIDETLDNTKLYIDQLNNHIATTQNDELNAFFRKMAKQEF
ncbi:nucleotidyltransferase domain-containing protein [Bacillus suaedaesalsae]|uniref:Nucleotidyltransferase domain-containing protein n=1 Tax=Bacillus suaedaesalsae TaxID=2810349 RepID=A0ABS2DLR7_9BACI|nr:nucleotidyltransferase domain-containing protein [Bacillus suaedaesalsae]MBM6619434.1 nucleotidyltransferase domain-containing protein [Bacillus suaedaesalsae]